MWIPSMAALLFFGGAPAQPGPAPVPVDDKVSSADLQAALVDLQDEYDDAYDTWRDAYRAASTRWREARAENPELIFEGPEPVQPAFFPRFDRLAQAGSPEAQVWCLTNYVSDAPHMERHQDYTHRVLGLLTTPGADLSALPRVLYTQARGGANILPQSATALLTVLENAAPDHGVKSAAAYYSASVPAPEGTPDEEAAKLKLEGMRAVAARYPDAKFGQRAGGFVFSQENLKIGLVAPDIVGKDVDGNEMKLSDFRGKVTVIDFWGFW